MQASYIEFLEAYARVCDEASIVLRSGQEENRSLEGETIQDGNRNREFEPNDSVVMNMMSEEERQQMPLHVKIENTIPYLLQNCTNKAFLDKFELPKKNPVIGLFVLPNKKFFWF